MSDTLSTLFVLLLLVSIPFSIVFFILFICSLLKDTMKKYFKSFLIMLVASASAFIISFFSLAFFTSPESETQLATESNYTELAQNTSDEHPELAAINETLNINNETENQNAENIPTSEDIKPEEIVSEPEADEKTVTPIISPSEDEDIKKEESKTNGDNKEAEPKEQEKVKEDAPAKEVQAEPVKEPDIKSETSTGIIPTEPIKAPVLDMTTIPAYTGQAYVAINNNVPCFTESEYITQSFETYSMLDNLGRCGTAYANIGKDIMPTEERDEIGSVKPSGWHTVKYDNINGKYLYNRCHLLAYQLSGENANDKNLITGTRSLNMDGMLPFENMTADYINENPTNHVLYRVTPIFENDNLLASGVEMEGYSVEDSGESICFHVYCYNVQPGIQLTYANGESSLSEASIAPTPEPTPEPQVQNPVSNTDDKSPYVVNGKNGKIHMNNGCSATSSKPMNYPIYFATYEEAEAYSIANFPNLEKRKCGNCWK